MKLKEIPARAKRLLERLRSRYRVVDVTMSTFEAFGEDDGGPYTAALTYYMFFSIFPLLLFGIALLGFVTFNNPELKEQIIDAGFDAFPMMKDLLAPAALETIEERRQELALTGIVLALYSGSGGVVALTHALNVMLDVPREQEANWLGKRLKALRWLAVASLAAVLSIAFGTVSAFAERIFGPESPVGSALAFVLGHTGGFLVGLFIFATAFRFLPARRLSWREVLPGAIAAALAFEVLKELGALVLQRGARGREATFGAFYAAATLLFVSYLLAQITLLGAELNGVLAERRRSGRRDQAAPERNDGDDAENPTGGDMTERREARSVYSRDGGDKSAGELMKEISEDLSTLVRKEVELAKQELGRSLSEKVKGAAIVGVAAGFGLFALIFLLLALRDGLDTFLWTWVADLVTAAALLLVAGVGALAARNKLRAPVSTELTKQTLKEDVEWAKTLGRG